MNADFHLDQDIRIDNQRHAAIVMRGDQMLLMHRIYKGTEFWTFPGGHIQQGEDPMLVAVRECEEETTVKVANPTLVFEFRNYKKDNHDFYYLCDYVSGEPTLSGEEKLKSNPDNFYEPMWVDLVKLPDLNILPKFAKEWVVETLIEKQ